MMMLMIAMDWTGYLLNDDDYDDRVKMMMIRTIRLRSVGRLYKLNDDDDKADGLGKAGRVLVRRLPFVLFRL